MCFLICPETHFNADFRGKWGPKRACSEIKLFLLANIVYSSDEQNSLSLREQFGEKINE